MLAPRPEAPSRSDVDIAVGVLVLLRRLPAEEAHLELLTTAVHHRVSLLTLSRALIALAADATPEPSVAADAAWEHWQDLRPAVARST